MTISELLNMSADELDALTAEQKEEYFKPYLIYTRPELQDPNIKIQSVKKQLSASKQQKVNDILKKFGIDEI